MDTWRGVVGLCLPPIAVLKKHLAPIPKAKRRVFMEWAVRTEYYKPGVYTYLEWNTGNSSFIVLDKTYANDLHDGASLCLLGGSHHRRTVKCVKYTNSVGMKNYGAA